MKTQAISFLNNEIFIRNQIMDKNERQMRINTEKIKSADIEEIVEDSLYKENKRLLNEAKKAEEEMLILKQALNLFV